VGDERPYCVALIVPNWEHLRLVIKLSGSASDMVANPQVRDYVQKRVDAVNATLGSWESIKYFYLVPEDFSEASGELTPTLKVKRRVVTERYADQIAELYGAARKYSETASYEPAAN
jgi:long-chain acyl-CoA synthetase